MVELGPTVAHGLWSEAEASLNSTWRKLKAVYLVLQFFAQKLAGHRVKWFTDNQGVIYVTGFAKTQHVARMHYYDYGHFLAARSSFCEIAIIA